MGLFPWWPQREAVELDVQIVSEAYDKGFSAGQARAYEDFAEQMDRALAIAEYDETLTKMLQLLSRHCKGEAARQKVGG